MTLKRSQDAGLVLLSIQGVSNGLKLELELKCIGIVPQT